MSSLEHWWINRAAYGSGQKGRPQDCRCDPLKELLTGFHIVLIRLNMGLSTECFRCISTSDSADQTREGLSMVLADGYEHYVDE
eukprot:5415512-Karenia_brevis.AAC.1